MTFDEDDLAMLATKGLLQATITHEMGHVLGIGTLWELQAHDGRHLRPEHRRGIAQVPSSSGAPRARPSAQRSGAGVVWTDSMVPLEGDGACFNGTRDGHPSESIFVNELMTGYIDPVQQPTQRRAALRSCATSACR